RSRRRERRRARREQRPKSRHLGVREPVEHGENPLLAEDILLVEEGAQLCLGPILPEAGAHHHDAKTRGNEALVHLPAEVVAEVDFVAVVPDPKPSAFEDADQRLHELRLVLARVADEEIVCELVLGETIHCRPTARTREWISLYAAADEAVQLRRG